MRVMRRSSLSYLLLARKTMESAHTRSCWSFRGSMYVSHELKMKSSEERKIFIADTAMGCLSLPTMGSAAKCRLTNSQNL